MNNNNLAHKVKEIRNRKGLSQDALSDHSGLILRTIQRIENGETKPMGDTLKKLANALEVNPDELIDWTVKEDNGFLVIMNLSALTFIIFPLLGIIIPFMMWVSKKDKLKTLMRLVEM
jgi:transcriptional regulator with XRE-family HTH domain